MFIANRDIEEGRCDFRQVEATCVQVVLNFTQNMKIVTQLQIAPSLYHFAAVLRNIH